MNEQDLTELPDEVRRDMMFLPVSTLEEALRIALPAPTVA
jgi:ATP-dependent Lon protease